MKVTLGLFITLLSLASIGDSLGAREATLNTCAQRTNKYTKFWGQEYTGSDLVRSELSIDIERYQLPKPTLAIFDTGFEQDYIPLTREIDVPPYLNGRRRMTAHHGTMVANLIGAPYPIGASENFDLVYLGAVAVPLYSYHIRKFEQSNQFPKIISNSVGWSNSETDKLTEITHKRGTLWFLAAGNDHPNPVATHEINSKALLVGAIAPNGLQSLSSQTHSDVLVLSPGNEELASIDGKGTPALFGGTSGATPLVAASALNIASFFPNITREQYRKLIEQTAWPSVENILGDLNAPGILNGYLAYRVVKRIFESCEASDENCLSLHLESLETYHFKSEIFITCEQFISSKCEEQSEMLTQMRRETLLGNRLQALELSCAYQSLGFSENAKFYALIGSQKVEVDELEALALADLERGKYDSPYYRYQNKYSNRFRAAVKESEQFDDYQKREILSYGHERDDHEPS